MKHFAILALLLAGAVQAQGTITFSVTPTSGNASVSPTATWSTTPAATSCSIDALGTVAASGTQALATVTKTTTYTITCQWAAVLGKATVHWVAPTTNSDGSPLTDLAGFRVVFGTKPGTLDHEALVGGADAVMVDIPDLTPGTWYFAVTATNAKGVNSDWSNMASKTIAGTPASTASKTATVTVNPVPSPPTNVTVIEKIAYYVRPDLQQWAFLRGGRYDGTAKLGSACDKSRATADGYTVISRPSLAVTPKPPTGTVLVARCG